MLREDRTAAEENCVAEATRRSRRIPRSRILFYFITLFSSGNPFADEKYLSYDKSHIFST